MDTKPTTAELIDALGGTVAVAELSGTNREAVWMWRKANKFPANTYLVLTEALQEIGITADPDLWGMKRRKS